MSQPRRLIVLGSTGSIGVNTLKVVEHLHRTDEARFEVMGLATGANAERLGEQAKRFGVRHLALAQGEGPPGGPTRSSRQAPGKPREQVFAGPDAAEKLIRAVAQPGDLVVGAMVGAAGIPATVAAIERGCDIALANKETLVAAGALVMPLARDHGVRIIPIDSEHSAIFQCLEGPSAARDGPVADGREPKAVRRIVITASGGPFRTWTKQRIDSASPQEALNHPTWNMGPKVTIDSASLMNKALEVIEAHWLFGLPAEKIEAIAHPQSLIHSFVEFVDGSVLAQLGPPDMCLPIQYALTWPRRHSGCARRMDWAMLSRMDFEPIDHERFGALGLAYDVIARGGTAGAVLNAANEAAVEAFLQKQIAFGRITELVREALNTIPIHPVQTLDDVRQADAAAREYVTEKVQMSTGPKVQEIGNC